MRDLVNALALLIALTGSAIAAWSQAEPKVAETPTAATEGTTRSIVDATGETIACAAYRRIASCSPISDAVLPELIASERIVMVTQHHRQSHPQAFRTAHAATFPFGGQLEELIPLQPDLVLVSNISGKLDMIHRARELGFTVVDLGPMTGRAALEEDIRLLADLLTVGQRGRELVDTWSQAMDRLARHRGPDRPRGLYLSPYPDQMYGGTAGSSYHDVLVAGGLQDCATERFAGNAWPRIEVEDLLILDPDFLVIPSGHEATLRRLPGIGELRVLREANRLIQVPAGLIDDPGLRMLPAATYILDHLDTHFPVTRHD